MAGCYHVISVPENDPNPDRVAFRAIRDVAPSPEEKAFSVEIVRDVIKFGRLANSIHVGWRRAEVNSFKSTRTFRYVYEEFLGAARGGLEYETGSLAIGKPALENARQSALVVFGRRARNWFLLRVLLLSVFVLAGSIWLLVHSTEYGSILRISIPSLSGEQIPIEKYIVSLGFAGIGIFLAVNVTNYWYLARITWEKVDFLDRDGLPASLRILGVVFVTAILMVMLSAKVFVIGLMSIELNGYADSALLSILVGLLCGAGEVAVSATLQRALSKPVVTPED